MKVRGEPCDDPLASLISSQPPAPPANTTNQADTTSSGSGTNPNATSLTRPLAPSGNSAVPRAGTAPTVTHSTSYSSSISHTGVLDNSSSSGDSTASGNWAKGSIPTMPPIDSRNASPEGPALGRYDFSLSGPGQGIIGHGDAYGLLERNDFENGVAGYPTRSNLPPGSRNAALANGPIIASVERVSVAATPLAPFMSIAAPVNIPEIKERSVPITVYRPAATVNKGDGHNSPFNTARLSNLTGPTGPGPTPIGIITGSVVTGPGLNPPGLLGPMPSDSSPQNPSAPTHPAGRNHANNTGPITSSSGFMAIPQTQRSSAPVLLPGGHFPSHLAPLAPPPSALTNATFTFTTPSSSSSSSTSAPAHPPVHTYLPISTNPDTDPLNGPSLGSSGSLPKASDDNRPPPPPPGFRALHSGLGSVPTAMPVTSPRGGSMSAIGYVPYVPASQQRDHHHYHHHHPHHQNSSMSNSHSNSNPNTSNKPSHLSGPTSSDPYDLDYQLGALPPRRSMSLPDSPHLAYFIDEDVPPALMALMADDWDSSELLLGETPVLHKVPLVHFVTQSGRVTLVDILITTYKMVFVPSDQQLETYYPLRHTVALPLASIEAISKDLVRPPKPSPRRFHEPAMFVNIVCKTAQVLKIGFETTEAADLAFLRLQVYCFGRISDVFAFTHGRRMLSFPIPDHYNGWKLYDEKKEYARMGMFFTNTHSFLWMD